jgi:hypothetical protein
MIPRFAFRMGEKIGFLSSGCHHLVGDVVAAVLQKMTDELSSFNPHSEDATVAPHTGDGATCDEIHKKMQGEILGEILGVHKHLNSAKAQNTSHGKWLIHGIGTYGEGSKT